MIRILAVAVAVAVPWCPRAAGAGEEAGTPAAWLKMLEDPDFGVREEACGHLGEWAQENGDKARDLFLDQVLGHDDPEVRMRCRELLRESVLAVHRQRGKGFVGIRMFEMQVAAGGGFGVRVIEVQPDTPAAKAALKVGYVIVELDGRTWDAPGAIEAFRDDVMGRRPGDKVPMKVQRQGINDLLEVEVELGLRPPDHQLMLQGLGGDAEFFRKQQEEMLKREEERVFERWLAERTRARGGDAPPAAPR